MSVEEVQFRVWPDGDWICVRVLPNMSVFPVAELPFEQVVLVLPNMSLVVVQFCALAPPERAASPATSVAAVMNLSMVSVLSG
jgi:hypothetical protein